MEQKLTEAEMSGWWKQKGEDFELYKIRKMTWVGVKENLSSIVVVTRNTMYITIASFLVPMPIDVFRAHFELVASEKDYTLDNEIKVAMLQIASLPTQWEQLNVEQTCKAMDFVRSFWDKNTAELRAMEHNQYKLALEAYLERKPGVPHV